MNWVALVKCYPALLYSCLGMNHFREMCPKVLEGPDRRGTKEGFLHGLTKSKTTAEVEDCCISKTNLRCSVSANPRGNEVLFTHLHLWPKQGEQREFWVHGKPEGAVGAAGSPGPRGPRSPATVSEDKEPEVQQEAGPLALAPPQTRSPPPGFHVWGPEILRERLN